MKIQVSSNKVVGCTTSSSIRAVNLLTLRMKDREHLNTHVITYLNRLKNIIKNVHDIPIYRLNYIFNN